jgi:thiol-disulfide isomerase/thioredoxin
MTIDSSPPQFPARRQLIYAGVGGAALVMGAGLAWLKWRPEESGADAAAIWASTFETPTGAPLHMSAMKGKPLLLNFWATWCAPCIEELPLLEQFYKENAPKSWQVVGLAIDQPSAVRGFLSRLPISFPVGLAAVGGSELSRLLGNRAGGLPYTVVVSGSGQVVQRRMGRVTAADLEQWVKLG